MTAFSCCKIRYAKRMSLAFISSAFAYFVRHRASFGVTKCGYVSAHGHTSTFVSSLLSSLRNWSWFMAIVVKVTHQMFLTMSTIRKNPFRFFCFIRNLAKIKWRIFPKAHTCTHTASNVTFSLPFVIINFYVRHIRRYIWPSIRW